LLDHLPVVEHCTFLNLALVKFISRFTLGCSLSCSSNQSILLKFVTLSEKVRSLMLIFEPHLSSTLASVKLDLCGAATATVARMFTFAELIEFSYHIVKVLSVEVSEDNGKFSLHFLQLD
jgi:hypothetical protein